MVINILAFGIAKDIFGKRNLTITVEESTTVKTLKIILGSKYPQLKKLPSFMVAINSAYAKDNQSIKNQDEIAIIPPTNGG